MSGEMIVAEGLPWPPSVGDFFPPHVAGPWVTKFGIMIWIAIAVLVVFFVSAYRKPKLVPGRLQWAAETTYGFIRDGVAKEQMGTPGIKFAPYLTVLFSFILLTNLFGIVPLLQISPNAHIAFPIVLTAITYVLYLAVGMRKHGVLKYLKKSLILPGIPAAMHIMVVPLEFLQVFIIRPLTLAVRLFANMFAGHLILLVFTVGGFVMLNSDNLFIQVASVSSFLMSVLMTFFEALVAVLQAYVFVVLTASYLGDSLAEEH